MPGTVLGWLRRRAQTGAVPAALVLVVGAGCALALGATLRGSEQRGVEQVMDRRTAAAQTAVSAGLTRYVDLAGAVAAAVAAVPDLTADQFTAITAALPHQNLPGAAAIGYVVPVADGGAAAAGAYWRSRGGPSVPLRPVGNGREHLFSVHNRSLAAGPPAANAVVGVDLGTAPEPAAAFEAARRSGRPALSSPYRLLRDRSLPPRRQQLSFLLAVPVFGAPAPGAPSVAAGAEPLRGWVAMGLRGQDFLDDAVRDAAPGTLDVELRATGNGRVVAAVRGGSGRHDLHRDVPVLVAGQRWTLRTAMSSAIIPAAAHLGDGAATAGLALTLVLAGLVYVLSTARTVAEQRVCAATAGLRAAQEESSRQAGLLSAVMNSISDGVGVVDGDGRFLLHNPAAKLILGVAEDVDGTAGWQEHYGLFRPDGTTPYPTGDLPLVRALRGEKSDTVEMVVRNAGRPDGVCVSVSARPLDPASGLTGAVAVFHDITEHKRAEAQLAELNTRLEERVRTRTYQLEVNAAALRELNGELEAFSYSVSHDLRAPLRAIGGFTAIVRDEYGHLLPDDGRRYLAKVGAGVVRMGQLIDGLLAFSRTQRQAMQPQEVHLDAVVADVWDELAPERAGRTVELVVGDLPACEGDPRLLRHVLANLLGNAVKYSRNRPVARVEVSGDPDHGRITYRVRDNGAGFDMRYADKLFKVFQRLHRDDEYEGTGVGLALSQRIVQRHGGRIWAESVPGEGSTFYFTLRERGFR